MHTISASLIALNALISLNSNMVYRICVCACVHVKIEMEAKEGIIIETKQQHKKNPHIEREQQRDEKKGKRNAEPYTEINLESVFQ